MPDTNSLPRAGAVQTSTGPYDPGMPPANQQASDVPPPRLALIGCYTTDGEPGLRSVRLHPDGTFEPLQALPMESPSCLVWHPTLPVVYATNENLDGGVTAVAVEDDGGLSVLGTASTSSGPCHAAVVADGRWLLTANYLGSTVTAVALAPDGRPTGQTDTLTLTGSGPHPRQDRPHPHMIAVVDDRLLCVDLGADTLVALTLSADGRLAVDRAWQLPSGTGPRQVVAHPDGDGALVVGELSATLLHVVLGDGDVAEVVAEVPVTGESETSFPAQLTVDGDQALVSNRGPDTLTVFATSPALVRVGEVSTEARWPRHFALVGDLVVVAGEQSSTVDVHRRDGAGAPGERVDRLATATPTWVAPRP